MPPYLPYPAQLVWLSGLAEVVLGLGLLTPFSTWATWAIILLLIAVLRANIYMLTSDKFAGLP